MPSFITPARLTAAIGVLTGLAAAVTAALGVVPHDGQVYLVGQEVAGLLTTGVTVFKFLEGQASWEQQQAQHAHEAAQQDVGHLQNLERDRITFNQPELAVVDGAPIDEPDPEGQVVDATDPETGEPQRLVEQAA